MSTIFDVARLAGVSRSTVSRVLNGQSGVSEAARTRVLQAIEQLNYRPNFAARALKRQRAETVGMIIPASFRLPTSDEPRGYYFTEIIRGAYNVVTAQRQVLALLDDGGTPQYYDRLIQQHQVDGILLVDITLDEHLLAHLQQGDFPLVVIGNPSDARVPCVDVDNYGSAQHVVRYLHRLGHRRIGMISGPPERLASRDRLAGYHTMMQQLGLSREEGLLVRGDFSEQSGRVAMGQLLALAQPPTAVFAANDRMALGALDAILAAGLGVPANISLMGFDDIPVARYISPPLTTMRQPLYELGEEGARLLLRLIAGDHSDTTPPRIVLSTALVERATTGWA